MKDVGSHAMSDRMLRAMAATKMTPVVDYTFDFDEIQDAYQYSTWANIR